MNEFKDSTLFAIENRIHAERLARSAVVGEAIGDALARAWFAARRLLGTIAGHATESKARTRASQHVTARHRIAAPH